MSSKLRHSSRKLCRGGIVRSKGVVGTLSEARYRMPSNCSKQQEMIRPVRRLECEPNGPISPTTPLPAIISFTSLEGEHGVHVTRFLTGLGVVMSCGETDANSWNNLGHSEPDLRPHYGEL